MGTSIYDDGLIDFASSLYGTDDDPMDAVMMLDGVVHNLLHAADQYGQVRVSYHPWADAVDEGQDVFETIQTSPTANEWYQVGAAPFGPWPLTLRADGSPYKLRVRVGGAVSATPATATFRVLIAPLSPRIDESIDANSLATIEVETTSTSPAWLTGPNAGELADTTLLTVSAAEAEAWVQNVAIHDAVSAASEGSIPQVLVAAHVWAKTTSATRLPRLYGLHISEYVGT